MWVSNTGHGPGLRRRLGRLCTTQGTQVWGQMGTELLQSVWPTVYTRFYQGREGFFVLAWFGFSRSHPKVTFKLALVLSGPTEFPQFAFHRKGGWGSLGSLEVGVGCGGVWGGRAQIQASLDPS